MKINEIHRKALRRFLALATATGRPAVPPPLFRVIVRKVKNTKNGM